MSNLTRIFRKRLGERRRGRPPLRTGNEWWRDTFAVLVDGRRRLRPRSGELTMRRLAREAAKRGSS